MHHVHDRVGGSVERIASSSVAAKKHTFPWHQHVFENYDAVHLFKSGSERIVEMGAAAIEWIAADEPEARRVTRNGECQRKFLS